MTERAGSARRTVITAAALAAPTASLSGYTIKDAANHTYRFGTYTLRAGSTVKVHTGRGSNTAANRYWQQTWYIWNNTGDKAVLRTSGGTVVDSCSFSGAGDSTYC